MSCTFIGTILISCQKKRAFSSVSLVNHRFDGVGLNPDSLSLSLSEFQTNDLLKLSTLKTVCSKHKPRKMLWLSAFACSRRAFQQLPYLLDDRKSSKQEHLRIPKFGIQKNSSDQPPGSKGYSLRSLTKNLRHLLKSPTLRFSFLLWICGS